MYWQYSIGNAFFIKSFFFLFKKVVLSQQSIHKLFFYKGRWTDIKMQQWVGLANDKTAVIGQQYLLEQSGWIKWSDFSNFLQEQVGETHVMLQLVDWVQVSVRVSGISQLSVGVASISQTICISGQDGSNLMQERGELVRFSAGAGGILRHSLNM